MPARLTMRLYRALALHGGATVRSFDTFKHVVSQPDLPASTTDAERNGLVRDTYVEVQSICHDRARRSLALMERDVALGTSGRGNAGAPVVGVHVCMEDMAALRGAVDRAETAYSIAEGDCTAAPTKAVGTSSPYEAHEPASRGFLAGTLPCARV